MPAKCRHSDSETPKSHRPSLNCKVRIALMEKISQIFAAAGKVPQMRECQLPAINHVANPHPLYHVCLIYVSSKTKIR
jgi:hypothetical protein